MLLYETLIAYGFARGQFDARPDDRATLTDCRIANAVRCVPPQNKPLPVDIAHLLAVFHRHHRGDAPSARRRAAWNASLMN